MKRIAMTTLIVAVSLAAPRSAGAFLDNLSGIGAGGPLPSGALASGRIIGGGGGTTYFFLYMTNDYSDAGDPGNCATTPDCRDWRTNGCQDGAPVGMDPALMTSIVDVASLAGDGVTHWLGMTARTGWDQFGVAVQFWAADCSEVVVPWLPPSHHASIRVDVRHPAYFRIPSNVKWMTVAGKYSIDVEWALYR